MSWYISLRVLALLEGLRVVGVRPRCIRFLEVEQAVDEVSLLLSAAMGDDRLYLIDGQAPAQSARAQATMLVPFAG